MTFFKNCDKTIHVTRQDKTLHVTRQDKTRHWVRLRILKTLFNKTITTTKRTQSYDVKGWGYNIQNISLPMSSYYDATKQNW